MTYIAEGSDKVMMGRISSSTRAVAAALLAGLAGTAHATPGDGIRLGGSEGRLHPFVDLESRYDSNVAFTTQAVGDMVLHLRPGLELKVPGDLAQVEFSGALDWAQYLGVEDGDTTDLSRMFANAGLAILFNPRRAVSVRVDDDYRRDVNATSLSANAVAVVSDSNVLTLSVPVTPGGGALSVTGRAQWLLESFSPLLESDPNTYDDFNYGELRADVDAQWRFLPRTATVFEAGFFQRNPSATGSENTTGFDVVAGMTGLLTQHVGATAKLGYASSSYTDPTDPSNPASNTASSAIADLGLEWLPYENLSVRAGYARSLGVDPEAAVYVRDAVSGGVKVRLAQRIALSATARWDRLAFDATPGAETSFVRIDPSVEALFGRWLTLTGGYTYSSRDATWPAPVAGTPPPADYSKNEVYVRAGFTY